MKYKIGTRGKAEQPVRNSRFDCTSHISARLPFCHLQTLRLAFDLYFKASTHVSALILTCLMSSVMRVMIWILPHESSGKPQFSAKFPHLEASAPLVA